LRYDSVWQTKKLRRRARRKVQRQGDQKALDESQNDVCMCGRKDCCCADYEECAVEAALFLLS